MLAVKESMVYASSVWVASTAGTVASGDTGASTCIDAFLRWRVLSGARPDPPSGDGMNRCGVWKCESCGLDQMQKQTQYSR